jgi:hypothetical protein
LDQGILMEKASDKQVKERTETQTDTSICSIPVLLHPKRPVWVLYEKQWHQKQNIMRDYD